MENHINVSEADLYALREFLVRHYGSNPRYSQPRAIRTREMFGGDHYHFTYVHQDNDNLCFKLRRSRWRSYDLMNFSYDSGRIVVEKDQIKDEMDDEHVRGITELLGRRCYHGTVSNLNDLID